MDPDLLGLAALLEQQDPEQLARLRRLQAIQAIQQRALSRPDVLSVGMPERRQASIGPVAYPQEPAYVPTDAQVLQSRIDQAQSGLGLVNPGVDVVNAAMSGDDWISTLVALGLFGGLGRGAGWFSRGMDDVGEEGLSLLGRVNRGSKYDILDVLRGIDGN